MTNREFYHLDDDCDGAFPVVFEDWCFYNCDCEHKEYGDYTIEDCERCYKRWLDLEFEGGVE